MEKQRSCGPFPLTNIYPAKMHETYNISAPIRKIGQRVKAAHLLNASNLLILFDKITPKIDIRDLRLAHETAGLWKFCFLQTSGFVDTGTPNRDHAISLTFCFKRKCRNAVENLATSLEFSRWLTTQRVSRWGCIRG